LEPRYSSLSLSDSGGKTIELGAVEISADDPKRLSAAVKPLPAGRYTIKFRVLSVDGHVVRDQFFFTVKQ
jgi:hypothetical protein